MHFSAKTSPNASILPSNYVLPFESDCKRDLDDF